MGDKNQIRIGDKEVENKKEMIKGHKNWIRNGDKEKIIKR